MSNYLGFQPTDNTVYYFVSYNTEDTERVGALTRTLSHAGFNLWYDYGIEYGDKWEKTIVEKLNDSQAVLLFFTKSILLKENSYVQKEYMMATQYLNRKVYVIMMDKITNQEIPISKLPWWIEITEHQCFNAFEMDETTLIDRLSAALGIETRADKLDNIIATYNKLLQEGRKEKAEKCLSEYIQAVSLSGKADLIAHIMKGDFKNTSIVSAAKAHKERFEKPFYTHRSEPIYKFDFCWQIPIDELLFTVGCHWVFHRGDHGDACVLWVWRNDELIFTLGGLIEVKNVQVFHDAGDNILYISYVSEQEFLENHRFLYSKDMYSITAIEDPAGIAICTDFRFLSECQETFQYPQ